MDVDRHVEPGRGLAAPGADGQHNRGAFDRAPFEQHGRHAAAVTPQASDASVLQSRTKTFRGAGQRQHQAIRLNIRGTLDRDGAARVVRDPRFHPARLGGLEPARRISRLFVLPGQGRLQPPRVRLAQGQGERGANAELDLDSGLLHDALGELAVQSHARLRDLGVGSRNPEAAQRIQTAIREPRGMAANGVTLDDHGPDTRPGEVVRRRHADDPAAHDHDVAADHLQP